MADELFFAIKIGVFTKINQCRVEFTQRTDYNIYHNIDKPEPRFGFYFEQRFVAKNSTSLNLSKRFQTRVSEHSIYYSFRGLIAQQQFLQNVRIRVVLKHMKFFFIILTV